MSNKTRTRTTRTTSPTSSSRNLRSIPDQGTTAKARTDTEDKLWTALHTNPNNTATYLANTAKIGKSTAAKILAKWGKDGSVTRTPGIAEGGRRAAALWAITDTDVGTEPTTDHTPTDNTSMDDVSTGDADSVDSAQPASTAPDTTTASETTVGDAKLPDAQPTYGDPTEATSTEPTDIGPTNTEATDTAKAEPGAEATTPTADSTTTDGNTATKSSDGGSGGNGKKARLSPGTLRGMVEDYLRDHPTEEFGPTAIAKALGGKSSGAVSNALDKLVDAGTAVKTKESPKRFALAPAERQSAPAATT